LPDFIQKAAFLKGGFLRAQNKKYIPLKTNFKTGGRKTERLFAAEKTGSRKEISA